MTWKPLNILNTLYSAQKKQQQQITGFTNECETKTKREYRNEEFPGKKYSM